MKSDSRASLRASLRASGLALAAAALSACALNPAYVRLRVEMSAAGAVRADAYREIVMAGFCIAEAPDGIDLDRELSSFLEAEFKTRTRTPISLRRLAPDDEALLEKEEFWAAAAEGTEGTLFLTGKARFSQELRKALLERDAGRGEDPFVGDKEWKERRSYTLEATVMLIEGATGRPVFEKPYKETASYSNLSQPAAFALFDILQRLKIKLFSDVLGAERLEERYLLNK
ncbi:MAG: hypothetical protein JW747_06010 [Candidatus Aminicenantes bacterium]|nr:hypothetical protein [Candidatus Aminicenantes bacterium]